MVHLHQLDIQGHRGARGLFPENTITAFIEAVKLGVHTLEMDVVISKDEKVVVSHEPWMNSVFCTKPNGEPVEADSKDLHNLYNMLYSEIAKYDCGTRVNPEFPSQKSITEYKPLLSEVIIKVDSFTREHNLPPVKYNIEIKSEPADDGIFNPDPATFVELVYKEVVSVTDRIILQSFDIRILHVIHAKYSDITMSFLVENKEDLKTNLSSLGFLPNIYGPEFILITPQLISDLRSLNIKLIPWTVNEIDDMKRLINMGVDGLITDYPDRLVNLVKNK